ncbi:MAG: serine protease [Candidatus Paceibacterota bacterium]
MKMNIKNPFFGILFAVLVLSCLAPSCQSTPPKQYLYDGQQTILDIDNAHIWARENIANPSAYAVETQSFADVKIYDNPEKTGKPINRARLSLDGSIGGGTVIAPNGYLITAGHVVDDSSSVLKFAKIVADIEKKNPGKYIDVKVNTEYTLTDYAGKEFLAIKVALGENDLALIQAKDPGKFTGSAVEVSREKNLADKTVIMIGSPLGIKDIIMDGRVARERITKQGKDTYMYVIAPIVPGNSGGAVIKLGDMKMAGVVTQVAVREASLTSIALFVPNDIINKFLDKSLPKQ